MAKARWGGIMGCMLLCASGAASAEVAAPAAAPEQLAEVIVTAEKRAERLNDVPLSVTAATGDELVRAGVSSAADLEKVVPGFIFAASSYGSPIYSIRGVGFYDDAMAISPAVSVYVDQIPLPFPRMTEGATLDLERVEVLKGPQGTLFGQNSTGGAVNYIAAKPTSSFEAGIDATYGRFNEFDAGGFVSGPIAEGLGARFAFKSEQRGDWQQSNSRPNDTLGQRTFFAGRQLLEWQANSAMHFELNLNGWINKSDTQALQYQSYHPNTPGGLQTGIGYPNFAADLMATPVSANNDRAADWDPQPGKYTPDGLKRDDRFYQVALGANFQLADTVELISKSSYSDLRVDSPADSDGTALPNNLAILNGTLRSYSEELRLAMTSSDAGLNWMLGGNYQHDDTVDNQDVYFNATNTFVGPYRFDYIAFDSDQRIRTKAAFGSMDYELTRALTLQGSMRYTDRRTHFDGCLSDPGTDGLFGQAFGFLSTVLSGTPTSVPLGGCVTLDPVSNKPTRIDRNLNEHNISWRGGLAWKVTPDTLLYGNVTRGFKAGSFGTLPYIRPVQATPVPQEELTAYEIGFKATLADRTLQPSGAIFYYSYADKQLRGYLNAGPPFGNLTALVSIPHSRVEGAELDVRWLPTPGLSINVGGTYVASKVQGATLVPTPIGVTIDVNGFAFPNTPKWQVVSDAEYKFAPMGPVAIFVGGSATYRSATTAFFEDTRDFDLPAYGLLDLRTGVETAGGRWRVWLWGKNVTDKYYWIHAEKITDTVARVAGMPATFGISVSTRF
jgi:iron complex outermembrane receptor protein